jgi:hypothetical protein
MEQQVEIPEHDKIDDELLSILHAFVGEDAEEEDLDAASNLLFSLVEQMVDDGEIDEIPETDVPDQDKNIWLEKCLPVLKQAFEEVVADMNSEDFEDQIDSEMSEV